MHFNNLVTSTGKCEVEKIKRLEKLKGFKQTNLRQHPRPILEDLPNPC